MKATQSDLVGIIPAAGYATRLQPLEGSKEMVRISGRPVMDLLLQRLRVAGCRDVRVVTRPEKSDVIRYATDQGVTVVLGRPRSVSHSLLAGVAGIKGDAIVVFGFPDTIWFPVDGFVPLVKRVEAGSDVALGVFNGLDPRRSDVVRIDEAGRIRRIEVKPPSPSSSLVWGCGASRMETLSAVADYDEPGDYFDTLCDEGRVAGVLFRGPFVDIGTRAALKEYTTIDLRDLQDQTSRR
jgi:NDP-sugar pyrophosphorylase family protein